MTSTRLTSPMPPRAGRSATPARFCTPPMAGRRGAGRSPGRLTTLRSVDFVDAESGWAVGGSDARGVVLHTGDGGATWEPQFADSGGPPRRRAVRRQTRGLGGRRPDRRSSILHTTDGGLTWSAQELEAQWQSWLLAVDFVSRTIGWVLAHDNSLTASTPTTCSRRATVGQAGARRVSRCGIRSICMPSTSSTRARATSSAATTGRGTIGARSTRRRTAEQRGVARTTSVRGR